MTSTTVGLLLSLCLLRTAVSSHKTTLPGLKLRLSQNGLNFAASVAIEEMTKDIRGKSLPDQHGSDHVAVGKVYYDLTSMHVTSFGKPASHIVVHPGSGVTWTLSNIGASVHGDWHYEYKLGFIKIKDHGSFDVSVFGARLSLTVGMGVDAQGRPTVAAKSCSCAVGSVHVEFHGGASWLYNLFDHNVEKPLRRKLQSILCDSANKAVNVQAAKQLAKMKVQVVVDKVALLDYRLVTAPEFGMAFIETQHKGEFFWKGDPREAPFQPSPLPEPPTTDKMISIWLSEYLMNTLGHVLQRLGILQYNLSKKDLPPKYASALNVTCTTGICIGTMIPQLKRLYPRGIVEVFIRTSVAPTINFEPTSVIGYFEGNAIYNVRLPNGSLRPAFTTYMKSNLSLAADLEKQKIIASVKELKSDIHVTNSSIGKIYDNILQMIFKFVSDGFIVPKLNDAGKKGLILPSIDDVDYVNPQLQLLEHTLCLKTDVKYNPGSTLYFSAN